MTVPRVAVVGMGGFAADHRSWARELDAKGAVRQVAQVAPAFDRRPFAADIAALRERGVAVYDSLRQMLAAQRREIDLVTIPTGIHLHRPMTVVCLEAGCHVLVEKPASGSIQDTDAMIRAEEQSGPQVTVGYQHLYREDVAKLKEWVCAGRFGAVRRVKAFGSWPRSLQYYGRNEWAGRYGLGDRWVLDAPHQNAMAHAVNLMCYLGCQRPRQSLTPESIRAELYRGNAIHSADSVSLRMRSAEGAEVFFAASHCTDEQLATVFVLEAEQGDGRPGVRGGRRRSSGPAAAGNRCPFPKPGPPTCWKRRPPSPPAGSTCPPARSPSPGPRPCAPAAATSPRPSTSCRAASWSGRHRGLPRDEGGGAAGLRGSGAVFRALPALGAGRRRGGPAGVRVLPGLSPASLKGRELHKILIHPAQTCSIALSAFASGWPGYRNQPT